MQQTILIVVIEVLIILLIALLFLQFRQWRKKNRRLADLERLIGDVKNQQSLREEKLVQCLIEGFKLDEESAQEFTGVLLDAEKRFLIQFMEQQFQDSVAGFYENLCGLLDSYLDINPAENETTVALSENAATETAEQTVDEEEMAVIDIKPTEEQAPKWGDVFD